MAEVILLLIPGFFSLINVYQEKEKINPDIQQWVFLPLIATYSIISFIGAKTISIAFILPVLYFLKLIFEPILYPEIISYIQNIFTSKPLLTHDFILISYFEYAFACLIAYLLPQKNSLITLFKNVSAIDSFLEKNKNEPLMLSLNDGKYYIGTIRGHDYWSKKSTKVIFLQLLFSGRKNEGILDITTSYLSLNPDTHEIIKQEDAKTDYVSISMEKGQADT